MFFALRGAVDAVLAGTGTIAAEGYGRLVARPSGASGAPPGAWPPTRSRSSQPLGALPDAPLLRDPDQPRAVYTGEDAADPARALRRVRAEHGVRSVLCEGGPQLNAALLAAGVLDELFLTSRRCSPAGADPLTVIGGGWPGTAARARLALEAGGDLLLRYAVARAG
jgi:riboflavin biosynthesis pyrimidine reductase